ncbi:MAG TPA: hypothetical protein VMB83_16370 [Roseiarcus sp.]|nr:hypothetical protein [Roseiarcus sp.]
MDQTALDSTVAPKTSAKARAGLFAGQSTLYIGIVLLAAFASYAYWLKTRSIFACQAPGYTADRYLAYCGGANYADFEHGAFYFNLEPPALDYARNADVLVLGNSRLQVALSNEATGDWFKQASARYYLLAFSYNEDMVFTEDLLRRMNPRASVYIINVDDFFERRETAAAKTILHDPDARDRYGWKRFSQSWHRTICGAFPKLCGNKFVIFRSRETGAYYRIPRNEQVVAKNAVSYDPWVDPAEVKDSTALAIDFLKQYAKGKCVILTNVPYPETRIGDAEAIAAGVGLPLVAPKLDGLYTSDGYHLDRSSADRWSKAFLEAAGPEIRSCLEAQGAARS